MKKITARKVSDWNGDGQYRNLLRHHDKLLLVGGCHPISARRSHHYASVISLETTDLKENWSFKVEKSQRFSGAAIQRDDLLVAISHNFNRAFTGYIKVNVRTGERTSRVQMEQAIKGIAVGKTSSYLGTALRGIYEVVDIDTGVAFHFGEAVGSDFQLESIGSIGEEAFIITGFDRSGKSLVYQHFAFNHSGDLLWVIQTSHSKVMHADSQLVCWDPELTTFETYDTTSGAFQGIIELPSAPIEPPIVIEEIGLAYASSCCSIHVIDPNGVDQIIYSKEVSGSIALAYNTDTKTLFGAFSGNFQEPQTHVVGLVLE